jgi:hypothetical protein
MLVQMGALLYSITSKSSDLCLHGSSWLLVSYLVIHPCVHQSVCVHDFAYVAKNICLTALAITNALMFDLRSPVVTGLCRKRCH